MPRRQSACSYLKRFLNFAISLLQYRRVYEGIRNRHKPNFRSSQHNRLCCFLLTRRVCYCAVRNSNRKRWFYRHKLSFIYATCPGFYGHTHINCLKKKLNRSRYGHLILACKFLLLRVKTDKARFYSVVSLFPRSGRGSSGRSFPGRRAQIWAKKEDAGRGK